MLQLIGQNKVTKVLPKKGKYMFHDQTVLILGAGASEPFGFPTGIQLKQRIIEMLKLEQGTWRKILNRLNYSDVHINEFVENLEQSGNSSVDAFLEQRSDLINVGKCAISMGIIEHERQEKLYSNQDNWYRYLYDIMTREGNSYGNNKLSVITYNYDRSFEAFMYSALKSVIRDGNNVIEEINRIPIVHVYGSLGKLPWQDELNGLIYKDDISDARVKAASGGIQILPEARATSVEFEKAHKMLRGATYIFFLGFGYNPVNLKRLKINDANLVAHITGTCYKMGEADMQAVTTLKNRVTLHKNDRGYNVLEYLRNKLCGYS